MSRILTGTLALLVAATAVTPCTAAADLTIGVVIDGPWSRNQEVTDLSRREILALTNGEFDVRFPDTAQLVGDWTYGTAQHNLQLLLDDPDIDLVVTWGILSSQAVCCLGELPKPVIAPVILDPGLQGLPYRDGTSGVKNLTYISLPDTLGRELRTFRSIVPFKSVAILTTGALLQAIPTLADRTRQSLAASGIDFAYVSTAQSADEVLAAIPPGIDAVYVWPLFRSSEEERARLIAGFIEHRLPSFSGLNGGDVEAGMLASTGSPEFFPKLARRVALDVQRILLGEDPGDIPVDFDPPVSLVINMATARAIDVSPRWEVLLEADLLHAEDLEGSERLSLHDAIDRAVQANLDLVARQRALEASAEEIALARSSLLPQLQFSTSGVEIDGDRAAASFGSQSERTLSGSAGLTQLVYSDAALANLGIQKRLQEGRGLGLETLRLDIALEAATTYLDLLRAGALERVQRNNVARTRSNLDVSRVRREIGVAAAGEVLRWESEVAQARKALVEAFGNRRSLEIAVNRLLHRPLDASFRTEEVSLETPGLESGQSHFRRYIDTPRGYGAFRDFVVAEGLQRAPELGQLDAGIAAQQRLVQATRRSFWAPVVSLQAGTEEVWWRGGEGSSGGPALPGLTRPDDTSWSVALTATLPLYAGGARSAERAQAMIELEQLHVERSSASEKIEQRIRASMEQARASFVGIGLANAAAEAARGNLDLVKDAYTRGVGSLLDLLDAQTTALNAEELAANALYDFLIDWLEAQRAANSFAFFAGPQTRREWFERLDRYMESRGQAPGPAEQE